MADFVCSKCGARVPSDTRKPKCDCGGLWKLDYTPPAFDEKSIDKGEWSIFRRCRKTKKENRLIFACFLLYCFLIISA